MKENGTTLSSPNCSSIFEKSRLLLSTRAGVPVLNLLVWIRAAKIDPFCLAVARRDAAFIAEPHDVTALYRHRGVNAVFLFAGDESGVRIKLHNLIPFTSKMGSM